MACKITYDGDTVFIENAMELLIAFSLTPPGADPDIISLVKEDMLNLVFSDEQFLMLLPKVLGEKGDSKIPFLMAFGDQLYRVVSDGDTTARTLALLANEADQQYFLNTLGKNYLRQIINSLEEIAACLEWLYGSMDTYFIELLGWEYIIGYISTGEQLGMIMRYVAEKEENELIQHMGWDKVFEVMRTPKDLYQVLTGMNPANERKMLDTISVEKLHAILPFQEQLDLVCQKYLSDEDAPILRSRYQA